MDNSWSISLVEIPVMAFNKSIVKYPSIKRYPDGASTNMLPNLHNPENPLPFVPMKLPKTVGSAGGG